MYQSRLLMSLIALFFLCNIIASLAMAEKKLPDVKGIHILYRTPPTPIQSCGVDSLYVCFKSIGDKTVTLSDLEGELFPGSRGVPVAALEECCSKHQISYTAIRMDKKLLAQQNSPMVLHVNDNHFIAFLGRDGDRFLVFDNSVGLYDCSPDWFQQGYRWDGTALVVGNLPRSLAVRYYAPYIVPVLCTGSLAFILWRFIRLRNQPSIPN
jgi:hypothetical protein